MAIKLADELRPMGDFPATMAEYIGFSDGETLQDKYNNKKLGGGDSSITLTQEEYDALTDEEKLNGLYYTYDTKRIYKNGVQYGASEPISLTMEEYKALKEAGAIDEQQEYLIVSDENGILLEAVDIGYDNAASGIQATTVQGAVDDNSGRIATLETGVATKQENIFKKHITSRKGDASDTKPYCLIASLKTSNLTFVNEPIIIEGVMGNATSSTQKMLFKASFDFRNGAKETAKVIYGYINQSSLFSHIDLITTFDESAEIAYIYVHHKTNYSIIDADISVPQRNAELYLTIPETFGKTDTIIGTEAHRMSTSTGVKVLAGLDDTSTSETSTWSSSKIAQQINNATAIKYDNVIGANATEETNWSLAQGESHFYGRLLQLDGHLGSESSTFSFLLFVKANYDNPTTIYATQLAGMDDDRSNITYAMYFELGVSSSGNLTIKNKSAVTASYRFI